MNCVTTVSFSVLINGKPSNNFYPQRGLRQGDPLSPYLFILCAEVLSGLLTKGLADGKFHGIQIAPTAPPISHLFFADDSLFFCRSEPKEANFLMDTLQLYQDMAGQKVNLDKSDMVFNPSLREDIKKDFQVQLPINISNKITKYLGLPTQFGRSKVQDFSYIMDKVIKKMKGWKERNLSFAGRSVLIKAVVQAIPVFVMSCFLLPQETCDNIERAVCKFWWGSNGDNKKIHWVRKDKVLRSTIDGGLGFRNLRDFNMVMLEKQIWRLHTNQHALISKVFKAKYYPTTVTPRFPNMHIS